MGGDFSSQSGADPLFRRRRRIFDQGELKLVILQSISESPSYGYEIIKALEVRLHGMYSPSPGVIYPTLTLLEELGYVTVSSRDDGKKIHSITPEGQAFLESNRETLAATFQRLEQTVNERPPPQIVRAMENLKLALRLRLTSGSVTAADIQVMAEVLDKAAVQVERK
jgi:DNA-binding PadR family transcriptional regulator